MSCIRMVTLVVAQKPSWEVSEWDGRGGDILGKGVHSVMTSSAHDWFVGNQ